jgi:UDP-N-acetylglucosamine acyltransferase
MTNVHPTAIVAEGAEIGEGVEVGPYCVIGPNVRIGDGTRVMAHAVLDGNTTFGRECSIFPFASIGSQTQDLKFQGGQTFVKIGDRTTLREYVTVNSGTHDGEVTRVGSDCHLMAYTHVAHACKVGDGVIMANCSALGGDVEVESQAVIGGLCAVHQFCRIGRLCMVGAGTKVAQDCPPFMIVDGNPARARGVNRVGLERKGVDAAARSALKEAYRMLYRSGQSTMHALETLRKAGGLCPEVLHLIQFVETSGRGIVN